MEFLSDWSFFFTYVSCLASLDSIVIWASDFMQSLCHSFFTKTILHGEAENPPSCNHSCCLFSCQTWGPWALRSLSLLEALLSLPQMFSLLHWAPCEPRPCLLCFIRPLQTNLPKRSGTQTQRRSCHPMLDKMDQSPVLSAHLGWMFPAVLWASEGRGVFSGGGRFRYSISVLSKPFGSCFPH